MKVSMRRLMALAMAGTMTLMAGCSQASSSATGSSDTQSASGESGAEKTASGDKTVIEYWHCNAETQGGLVVDDLVKKFNEENDHIEVVAKYNPDMYKGLMEPAGGSGDRKYTGACSDWLGISGLFLQ